MVKMMSKFTTLISISKFKTEKEKEDATNSIFSLVKDISKAKREELSSNAKSQVQGFWTKTFWFVSKLLLIGFIIQFIAQLFGADTFIRGVSSDRTETVVKNTVFNEKVLQNLRVLYEVQNWQAQGYSFAEYIQIVIKATKIKEEQDRSSDKETGFMSNLLEGVFRKDLYSSKMFSDSNFIDGLSQIDATIKSGGAQPPFTGEYRTTLDSIYDVATHYVIDTDEKDKKKLQAASAAKISNFMLAYKINQGLGFADKYIPKWLTRVGMAFMVLLTLIGNDSIPICSCWYGAFYGTIFAFYEIFSASSFWASGNGN